MIKTIKPTDGNSVSNEKKKEKLRELLENIDNAIDEASEDLTYFEILGALEDSKQCFIDYTKEHDVEAK